MDSNQDFIIKDNDSFFKPQRLNPYMSNHKGYIAGGCFKDIFLDQRFKDVDIFFESAEDFNQALEYYRGSEDHEFVYENNNAICFKDKKTKKKLELIRAAFASPMEMLDMFDFTIVKFAYYKEITDDGVSWKYMYHKSFFEDLVNRKLVIDKTSQFPVNTFERTYRYRKYGFGMCRETKKKLIEMLQNADIETIGNDLYFGFD